MDFLETLLEDLVDRISILAGLPDEIDCARVAVEIADLVRHRRVGRWEAVRSPEARTVVPAESIARRASGGNATSSVLWIDATGEVGAAVRWADHARQFAESADMPRLCIAMDEGCAEACREDKRLRRRVLRDFLSPLDTRVLVERFCRRSGYRPAHIGLRSAIVSELAGTDLVLAERLSRVPLDRIMVSGQHPRERIWAAQVAVLFPILERERQRLLEAHRSLWQLPHTRPDNTVIRCRGDLEIGDMRAQAWNGQLRVERQRLEWLHRVRNKIAHNDVVPWGTLISPTARRIADFRQ